MTIENVLNEINEFHDYFKDCIIIDNNTIVGFYKTFVIKYKNQSEEEISYLFPTTFQIFNGNVHTTMVFGSIRSTFKLPNRLNGTGHGTELSSVRVGGHSYSLLAAKQHYSEIGHIDSKPFMCIIEALDIIGFPFMRIAGNESIAFQENTIENYDIGVIMKLIEIYKPKSIFYIGKGLKNIILPIAQKNILVNIVGGELASQLAYSFWYDEELDRDCKPNLPEWINGLPISTPIEGFPDSDFLIIDSLEEKDYIANLFQSKKPKYTIFLNNTFDVKADMKDYLMNEDYFWQYFNNVKFGILIKIS